jgi:hypothetical protein
MAAPSTAPPAGHTRPIVFFDVNIGETPAGRLKMELYSDIVPKYVTKPRPTRWRILK